MVDEFVIMSMNMQFMLFPYEILLPKIYTPKGAFMIDITKTVSVVGSLIRKS